MAKGVVNVKKVAVITRPLQSKAQRNETYGRGYAYAQGILTNGLDASLPGPPFSTLTARTLLQRAWYDAYRAALRDVRNGKVKL